MCLKESMVPFGDDSQKAVQLLQNYYYYCLQNSKLLQKKCCRLALGPISGHTTLFTDFLFYRLALSDVWKSEVILSALSDLGGSRLPWGTVIKPHHL
jgi:hypothetical protein